MKKMNLKNMFTVALSGALALSLLSGCGTSQTSGKVQPETTQASAESKAAGTVLLSVNPEIEVAYDNSGLVLEIEGMNEDGKSVVKGVDEYKGKDCQTVVNEIVKEIYEAGYFDETMDGHTKNIVLKLEEGSSYPGDDFLEKVAEGVREAVKTCGIGSNAMTVQEAELDDQGRIGQEKAKKLLLAQLGLTSASFNNHEYELDDNVYEFELSANGVEYEYEVDARTGKIQKADIEGNDDWDDNDQWDDWEDFGDDQDDKDDKDDNDDNDDKDNNDDQDDNDDISVSIPVNGGQDDDWDDGQNDDWDDGQDDDWDDGQDDDWDDGQDDDWDDGQNDDWDDGQNDDWDDGQDDWDDGQDDWDDGQDDWDDGQNGDDGQDDDDDQDDD